MMNIGFKVFGFTLTFKPVLITEKPSPVTQTTAPDLANLLLTA